MSFIGGGKVPAYTRVFLNASPNKHAAGSFETIVVPYIEIGRSSGCAIRFSDEADTVRRKHAALEKISLENIAVALVAIYADEEEKWILQAVAPPKVNHVLSN